MSLRPILALGPFPPQKPALSSSIRCFFIIQSLKQPKIDKKESLSTCLQKALSNFVVQIVNIKRFCRIPELVYLADAKVINKRCKMGLEIFKFNFFA